MTILGHSFYKGRETMQIMENLSAHAGPESEPYKCVMGERWRACGTGLPMPDDTAPFSKLGPVAWVSLAVILALPIGMVIGAAAKVCDCSATAGAR